MARKRPIRTVYFNRQGLIARVGRASTLTGAVKGATLKVYARRFYGAQITLNGCVIMNIYIEGREITIKRTKR
jgi:hypothetical protein